MGRRIYDQTGEFVWKYTFGRQPSEMCRYAEEFNIGKYVTETIEDDDSEDSEAYESNSWEVSKKDISELKALLKKLGKGKTREELNEIGMNAVKEFVASQSKEWKEAFKGDMVWVKKAKSEDDFQHYGSSTKGHKFEVYDIFANAIAPKLCDTFDFYAMTEAFIKRIESGEDEEWSFEDEY